MSTLKTIIDAYGGVPFVAEQAGLAYSTVRSYHLGLGRPRIDSARKLAPVLHMSTDLLGALVQEAWDEWDERNKIELELVRLSGGQWLAVPNTEVTDLVGLGDTAEDAVEAFNEAYARAA
jgi:hypothetical protein